MPNEDGQDYIVDTDVPLPGHHEPYVEAAIRRVLALCGQHRVHPSYVQKADPFVTHSLEAHAEIIERLGSLEFRTRYIGDPEASPEEVEAAWDEARRSAPSRIGLPGWTWEYFAPSVAPIVGDGQYAHRIARSNDRMIMYNGGGGYSRNVMGDRRFYDAVLSGDLNDEQIAAVARAVVMVQRASYAADDIDFSPYVFKRGGKVAKQVMSALDRLSIEGFDHMERGAWTDFFQRLGQLWSRDGKEFTASLSVDPADFLRLGDFGCEPRSCYRFASEHEKSKSVLAMMKNTFVLKVLDESQQQTRVVGRMFGSWPIPDEPVLLFSNSYGLDPVKIKSIAIDLVDKLFPSVDGECVTEDSSFGSHAYLYINGGGFAVSKGASALNRAARVTHDRNRSGSPTKVIIASQDYRSCSRCQRIVGDSRLNKCESCREDVCGCCSIKTARTGRLLAYCGGCARRMYCHDCGDYVVAIGPDLVCPNVDRHQQHEIALPSTPSDTEERRNA